MNYAAEISDWKKTGGLARKQMLTLRLSYENYGNYQLLKTTMKTSLLLAIFTAALYFYLRNSPPTPVRNVVAPSAHKIASSQTIVIAAAPSYHDRWNTGPNAQTALQCGPNAQTALKDGPNAQTEFEPFAPSQHATWNQNPPGYSIVSGTKLRVR